MVELKENQIRINGEPKIILCGEIHYFRLPAETWEDRINKLIEAGANAVATYVPWILHEEVEGQIDLVGRTKPHLNLARFIDLCHEKGLYFFLRPGPFIMAEMKNGGLPFWLMEKYPEIVPTTWDSRPITTETVDYLAPNFLKAVKRWYQAVMEIAVPRLEPNGGNIIAIQLDNEIGMFSWVSNQPDLTDNVLKGFINWLKENYTTEELIKRYPFSFDDYSNVKAHLISPEDAYALPYIQDLGYFMRYRFARYVKILQSYCETFGVKDIPYIINIHGMSGGRAFTFPIGISQLFETYQDDAFMSGSDIYFGDLTIANFHDLYLINGMMDAMHSSNQPLSSIEFNCGDGNWGDNLGSRYDVSAVDMKARMCIAQGNRLLNYYLFTGGYNDRLTIKPNDGNDRIAITGERHGYAAPISPEGEYSYVFPKMRESIKTIMANQKQLATMREERDNVAYGFIPDYFMTEYHYPHSQKMLDLVKNLERHRAGSAWDIIAKLMLLDNYRFGVIDIQHRDIPESIKVLILPSARYMHPFIQQKLVDFVKNGGSLLLTGELPQYDMEGNPCTLLLDALNVKVKDTVFNRLKYYLSVVPAGWAQGAEIRTDYAQIYELNKTATPLYTVYPTDDPCAFETTVERGKVIMFGCQLKANFELIRTCLSRLGAKKAFHHDHPYHGLFITSTINDRQERYIHLINLDGFDKTFRLYENGKSIFDGKALHAFSRDSYMLSFNIRVREGLTIVRSTAELFDIQSDVLTFRLTQPEDEIILHTTSNPMPSDDYAIERLADHLYRITSKRHGKIQRTISVTFA